MVPTSQQGVNRALSSCFLLATFDDTIGTASGATANAEWECETRGPTFRALSGNLENSSPPNIIL